MTKEIQLAVVGCGYWGSRLIDRFKSLPELDLVATSDLDISRLEKIKKRYPELTTEVEYKILLEDEQIKAIAIATPVSTHYRIAKESLKAGKHVFCEKPLATNSEEAEELAALAKDNCLTLMTDSTYLYHPAIGKIKEYIDSGKLGSLLFVQSMRLGLELFPKGTDVVWDLAPHDISLSLYFLEKMPEKISFSENALVNIGVADTAFINLSFSENQAAQILVGWLSPVKIRHFVVGGTKGTILFDETKEDKLLFFDTKIEKVDNHNIFQPVNKGVSVPYPNQEPLILVCRDFIDSIMAKKEPLAGGEISVKTVRVLERIK